MVAYEEVLPDSPGPNADKEEWLEYLNQGHGDIEDGKVTLLFIADEQGFDLESEDIEVVTDEPPTTTFS